MTHRLSCRTILLTTILSASTAAVKSTSRYPLVAFQSAAIARQKVNPQSLCLKSCCRMNLWNLHIIIPPYISFDQIVMKISKKSRTHPLLKRVQGYGVCQLIKPTAILFNTCTVSILPYYPAYRHTAFKGACTYIQI